MTEYIISQVLAFFAAMCLAVTFFLKDKKKILIFNIVGTCFFAVEYLLLNAFVGVVSNCISLIGLVWYFINDRKGKKKDYISISVMSALFIIFGIVTFTKWVDVLVIIASLTYTYSIWQSDNFVYRWYGIINSILWMVYNFVYIAFVSIVFETICLIAKIVGVIKLYINRNADDKTNKEKVDKDLKLSE